MIDRTPSHLYFREKADELLRMAAGEPSTALREQHLRIAAMYQALADRGVGAASSADSGPRLSIPKGLLRQG